VAKDNRPAPEFPGAIADPARFGAQHDFNQTGFADRLLQHEDVVVGSEIHGLRDDAMFGMRLPVDRLPPEVFPAKARDCFLCGVIRHHGVRYQIWRRLSTTADIIWSEFISRNEGLSEQRGRWSN